MKSAVKKKTAIETNITESLSGYGGQPRLFIEKHLTTISFMKLNFLQLPAMVGEVLCYL